MGQGIGDLFYKFIYTFIYRNLVHTSLYFSFVHANRPTGNETSRPKFDTSETGYVFESRRISINKRGGDPSFGLRPSLSEI